MPDTFEALRAALGDRYLVEREIGAGGMATVYLAQDLRHRRPVAIKVVRPELGRATGVERFLREIELAARLQHPHILPVFDSGSFTDPLGQVVPYFVMPYVEGETLRQRLLRDRRLPLGDAVAMAAEVADALAYAHQHGVVHRDIKPENILISGGHAVVADFGVAKAMESGAGAEPAPSPSRLTMAGWVLGTPHYMSPEQATGRDVVDARSDQYSLGCVLYETLTGEPPFDGKNAQAIIAQSLSAPRPRPSRARKRVSSQLDQLVLRAMAVDPAERYPDMPALAAALRAVRGEALSRRVRRRLAAAAVLLAVVAALIGAWLANRVGPRAVAPGAEAIAVLPFSATGPGVEFLREGMVDLLSTNLKGVGGIRTVDPRAVLRRSSPGRASGGSDLNEALAAGRDLGAASVVVGSAVSTGGRVRLAADLYSLSGERIGRAQVDGPADSVLPMVDRLSVALLRDVWRSREPVPNLRIGALTTDSLEALRAFLEGERYYRRLTFDSALAAYTHAVEVDSTFALAHLRRALVYGWTGGYGSTDSRAASAAAFRFASRLTDRDRRLLAGYRVFESGKPEAVDSMRAFLAQYPGDIEGWYLLGEALFHTRQFAPVPPETVSAAFDSALRRDSTLEPALLHPIELALTYRDSVRFARYFHSLEHSVGVLEPDINIGRAAGQLIWGPPPSDSALRKALATQANPVLYAVSSTYRSEEATSDSVLQRLARVGALGPSTPFVRARVLEARAFALAGLGRLNEVRPVADSLKAVAPDRFAGVLGWPIALGIAPVGFASGAVDSVIRSTSAGPWREFGAAVNQLARGHLAEGRRHIAAGLASKDSVPGGPMARGLLVATRGWAGLLAGDSAAGIRDLRSGIEEAAAPGAGGPTAFMRFQLALALSSRPETRAEGIRWLRYAFDTDPLYLPLSYLALGRAYEASGVRDSAAFAYGRFIRLWDKADPSLQDRVREAREALTRLTSER